MRSYRLSDESSVEKRQRSEQNRHLLDKGLQQSIAQLFRGLITKYLRTVDVTVIMRSKNVSYLKLIQSEHSIAITNTSI